MKRIEVILIICSVIVSLALIAVSAGYKFSFEPVTKWFQSNQGRDVYPMVPVAAFPVAVQNDNKDYCIGDTDQDGVPERWVYHSTSDQSWVSSYEY